jgi:RNase adaptor protein for sRNA GlmZ degradation
MLTVSISSFSYHIHGIPQDPHGNNGGFVFDCRCLPNPGRQEFFVHLTGKDPQVASFLSSRIEVQRFLASVFSLIEVALENYAARGFSHLTIAFGCTGGQHRSVFCAEQLAGFLREKKIMVELHHLSLHHEA